MSPARACDGFGLASHVSVDHGVVAGDFGCWRAGVAGQGAASLGRGTFAFLGRIENIGSPHCNVALGIYKFVVHPTSREFSDSSCIAYSEIVIC